MTTSNGLFSSDSELFVNGDDADPAPFTFQSDLSDDDAPDPLALDEIASASLAAMAGKLESLWGQNEAESKSPQGTKGGQVDGLADSPMDESENVMSIIEVQLPWLPPAARAGYQKVEVDEYWPDEYHRTRRKRKGVSYSPFIASRLLFSRLEGEGASKWKSKCHVRDEHCWGRRPFC
jgi:hypothetical protein